MRPRDRVARLGDDRAPDDDRQRAQRDVDDEDRPPPEVVEQEAADDRAERDAEARGRRPDADRHRRARAASVKTLIRSESVAGMMNAAPGAHDRAVGDQRVDAAGVRGGRRGERRTRRAPRAACGGARSGRRACRPAAAARRTRACRRRPPTGARSTSASRSRTSVGRATLTIVLSMTIASRLAHSTPSAGQRPRAPLTTSPPPGSASTARPARRSRTRMTTPKAISQTLHRT